MKVDNFDIQRVIEYLQGSTATIVEAITELYDGMDETDLTEDDYNAINNEIRTGVSIRF